MNEREEAAYTRGSRMAWSMMLLQCLKNLGYDDPEAQKATWVLERENAIAQLRDVCSQFGDNDWDEMLHLGDVIEKHLGWHLYSKEAS